MKLAFEIYVPLVNKRKELPPILFVHGLFESRKTWKVVAPLISNHTGRKAYAIDIRNHGESDWGRELNFKIMSQDIAEFFLYHGITKAVVIGHSLGGILAMNFALCWAEKVEMLILEDSYTKTFKPSPNGVVAQCLNIARDVLEMIPKGADLVTAKDYIRNFALDMITEEFADKTKEEYYTMDMIPLKKNGDEFSWQADLEGLIDMVSTSKIEHQLSGVYEGDTLCLYGSGSFYKIYKDPGIPKLFPKATLKRVDGASHFVHSEQPETFVNEVVSFINEHTYTPSKY